MPLNKYSQRLLHIFESEKDIPVESANAVSPLVSELASWYEKFRNSIEYRDEEVILRAAIERILKRRLVLGGDGKSTAKPLLKELVWARYFPDSFINDENSERLEKIIDFYLSLKTATVKLGQINEGEMRRLIFQLMSSEIEEYLNPNRLEESVSNYIFHVLKRNIIAGEELEEERDVQLFIAIRRAYSKDDIAFLRYKLFFQYFGNMTELKVDEVALRFADAYRTIENQLKHPARFKLLAYVKRQIPAFLIMEDIFANQNKVSELVENQEELNAVIYSTCDKKYQTIAAKVKRAIIRSVIFILLSKTLIAFAIEGTYESIFYGHIQWMNLSLNIIIPTLFMILVGFLIRTPGRKNSELIAHRIHSLLYDEEPKVGREIVFPTKDKKPQTMTEVIFGFLWVSAFLLSFGGLSLGLSLLSFSFVSQGIFIFFLAIVCFLAYRINISAKEYTVENSQSLLTPVIDFFFMPVARVGQYLTAGISQVNIFLFILDFIIEAPYKAIVGFFDQWFFFLHSKREELG